MRTNVSDNLLKELKQSRNMGSPHRKALTVPEQDLFMDFLAREDTPYHHWKPIFTVLLGKLVVGNLSFLLPQFFQRLRRNAVALSVRRTPTIHITRTVAPH